ncbi:DUF2867 domain-containing protein [Dyadobacter tibetensis]|uniref:DUF2867 domain-containing protein n=1 Tax=Dyadobacter tibetensis TaxID=1211851 RepID=UPI000470B103|nr:DUF2867 domain-containing protein [Dyadobacter tibetensis]
MNKVIEEPTPSQYLECGWLHKIDFADTFSTINRTNDLAEIANLIFNNPPRWIKFLFSIRNKLAALIGLEVSVPSDYRNTFIVGGYVGIFKIYALSKAEIVLGADDSHLNFRAIIAHKSDALHNIKLITLVQYNNAIGKVYMSLIKPFHRLVVRVLVKRAFKGGMI